MSIRFIFLGFICFVSPIHAMKRSSTSMVIQKNVPKEFPNYELWLPEIKNIIIDFVTHNTLAKKPKEATQMVNALARVDKRHNALINESQFSDSLIKKFASRFYCSHETIARFLHTKEAKKRLDLQYELKRLCCAVEMNVARVKNRTVMGLDGLIRRGIDLEFTYIHDCLQKTPLMLSAGYNNHMFDLLLKKVDINNCNSQGLTALKFVSELPIKIFCCKQLLADPQLIIDQQNSHGETALLRCLIRRQYVYPLFISLITELIKAGADPELANKYGVTPLAVARRLGDREVISIIQHAIEKKQSLLYFQSIQNGNLSARY